MRRGSVANVRVPGNSPEVCNCAGESLRYAMYHQLLSAYVPEPRRVLVRFYSVHSAQAENVGSITLLPAIAKPGSSD